jgi:predicted metal-dependent peptidase
VSDSSSDKGRTAIDAMDAALRGASMMVPHLAGLARFVRIVASERARTASIFASGRLVVNPSWFASLSKPERIFIAAHELMHLALRTHDRRGEADPQLFNIAHDYIINDMLRTALGMEVPAEGLDWPGAASLSAEKIYAELRSRQLRGEGLPREAWSHSTYPFIGNLGEAMSEAGLGSPGTGIDLPPMMDALDDEIERRWFPQDQQEDARRRKELDAESNRAVALGVWRDRAQQALDPALSAAPAGDNILVDALESRLRPPWELAMQRWLEDAAPGARSFARASRRQGERSDLVLAGRKREGWTLNLVLDTSGSMTSELARVLGVIKSFCESTGIATVRILQCDDALQADAMVSVERLSQFHILGGSNSDLSPALLKLARDPEVDAVIAITDGAVDYPADPLPYNVLWAITGGVPPGFRPSYGRILQIGAG